MKGLRSIVPLSRDSLRGIEAATIVGEEPNVEWANPRDLFVEEGYQRDVSEAGTALIRRIVAEFSWHKFKAPICFRAPEYDGAIVVIDGQHTSIGCATRGIERIPIMVYPNATAAQRAAAFVAHNRDRVALTMQAVFKADLAAGDLIALQADRACRAAGAKILTHAINLAQERPVGETMAVGTLRSIVRKVGAEHLERVMKVLVAAKRGPIKAQEISAVSNILLAHSKVPEVDGRLAEIVASRSAKSWASLGAQEAGTLPQALATLWLRLLDVRSPAATKKEPGPPPRPSGVAEARARELPRTPAEDRVLPPPTKAASPPAPVRPPPRTEITEAAPKKASVVFLAQANGITVSLDGTVARIGWKTAEVGRTGAQLLARLVTVMPAQLDEGRLALKLFEGRPNPRLLLDDLVRSVNPDLRKAGLEIFHIKASGYMLRDSGDKRLSA